MQAGLLLIGSLLGAVAAAAVVMSGHSLFLALLVYSLVGSLGTVLAVFIGCALSRVPEDESGLVSES